MRYDPVSMFSKLSEAGVKFDIPDPLRKMVSDTRDHRKPVLDLSCPSTLKAVVNYRKSKGFKTDDSTISQLKHALEPPVKVPSFVDKLPEVVINKKGKPARPLMEIPKQYMNDVLNFLGYLSSTANRQFKITFRNLVTGEGFIKYKPYVHRWTDIYRKGVLAKMYQLEAYLGDNLTDLEFITLTTYQKGSNRIQNLYDLCKYRTRLLDLLRWKFGTIDYLWIFEPHESGFAHLHLVYFKKLTDIEKDSLKKLWSEKYEVGSYDNGLKFSPPRASDNGYFVAGTIGRIKGYLMKYLAKGLNPDTESFHEYVINGKSVKLDMTLHELLFNSLLKKTKTRLWGCSRNFSKIMKRPEPEQSVKDWECTRVEQLYVPYDESETQEERDAHLTTVLWDKEAGLRPDVIKKLFPLIIKGRPVVYSNMSAIDWIEPVTHYKLKGYEFKEVNGEIHVMVPKWFPVGA